MSKDIEIMRTTVEAAKEIGVVPSRVRQLVRDGKISATLRGGILFFTPEAIEQAKARNTKSGPKFKKSKTTS